MDPLNSVGANTPVQKIVSNPIQKEISASAPKPLPLADRLELSGVSHMLKSLKSSNDVRVGKVAGIKSQIESGSYDNDGKKLDAAIDKMLDDVLKG